MEIYVMDAFSDRIFGGNQAGVALPERELPDGTMQAVAAEMKHSETAFVRLAPDGVHLRYFTPAGEVDLCGHATVGSFALLRALGKIGEIADRRADEIQRALFRFVFLTVGRIIILRAFDTAHETLRFRKYSSCRPCNFHFSVPVPRGIS